jgi:hypothetical protein
VVASTGKESLVRQNKSIALEEVEDRERQDSLSEAVMAQAV